MYIQKKQYSNTSYNLNDTMYTPESNGHKLQKSKQMN